MNRHSKLAAAAAAAATTAVLLSGCATAAGQEEGDTFVFLSDLEPVCFDTAGYKNLANYNVARQILDPLVWQAPDGTFSPALAESWESSDDGLTWTFTLRDDVTFHDGNPLTADDVEASVQRFFVEGNTLNAPSWYESSKVVDENTWELTTPQAYANILQQLSNPDFPILSAESIEEYTDGDRCADPTTIVGTGPFIPTEYEKGSTLTLERNEDYAWGPEFAENTGPAYFETLEIRFVPEAQARVGALLSGQADAASAVPPLNADEIENADGFELLNAPATGVPFTAPLNTTSGPTADVRVREALQRSVDLDEIVDSIYAGRYDRAWTALAPTTPPLGSYNEELEGQLTYDPEAAAALLAEAGYTEKNEDGILVKDGEPLVLRWIVDSGDIRDQRDVLIEAIQAGAREVGFDIQIEQLDTAAYLARIEENTYEALAESWGQSDAFILGVIVGPIVNYSKYENDALNAAVFEAWASPDEERRVELHQEIQQIVADDAVVWPLYVQNFIVATGDDISGLTFDPVGYPTSFYDVQRTTD